VFISVHQWLNFSAFKTLLFIFRKLRRSFFQPGKLRTYVAYAFGEIALIMIGILLAIQVSEWNQARKDRAEETEILLRLKTDFSENQDKVKQNQDLWIQISTNLAALERIMKPNPESHPDELIHKYMIAVYHTPAFSPNTGVLNSLITSGKMGLIKNHALNYELNAWPAKFDACSYTLNVIVNDVSQYFSISPKFHQLRDGLLEIHTLDSKYKNSEVLNQDFLNREPVGPSEFPYDPKVLLSQPELETAVEQKRLNSEILVFKLAELFHLQQSILDLIDEELSGR